MRKILLITLAVILSINVAYAADDDSTPYNPYPEPQTQNQTQTQTQIQKKSDCPPKKTQAKKRPAKKTSTRKRASTRKKSPAKVSAPKPDLLQQAITLMEQGNYETAKRYLLRAINLNRRDPNVWYWYGKYHEYIGNFYQAQFFYSKAVKLDPSFEKLSRVVYYPNDPEKTPLWDPKRPARVYPVETSGRGVTTIRPDAIDRVTYPKAPDDPQLPKVPVYTPPEPGSSPLNGDEWAPSVYVPPVHEESDSQTRQAPAYVPPANNGIISDGSTIYQEVTEIVKVNNETSGQPVSDRERIVRADKPLYTPPEPGQAVKKVTQTKKIRAKTQTQEVKKQTAKKESVKKSRKSSKRDKKEDVQEKAPVTRKTVRRQQTQTQSQTQMQRQETRQTQTQTQNQSQNQSQTQRTQPRQTPVPEVRQSQPQTQRQESRPSRPEQRPESRQQQYMPPVGQYAPDPGIISETPPPPVGQGN